MDLQYPENDSEFVQFPSSDIAQTSPPPPSPGAFSQDEPDIHFEAFLSNFDLDGDSEPIPADLDSSERDLGDERPVPADFTELHQLINGMYINYITSFE
jgi:hypothetical protein